MRSRSFCASSASACATARPSGRRTSPASAPRGRAGSAPKPRNPLHLDSIEDRGNSMSQTLNAQRSTYNTLKILSTLRTTYNTPKILLGRLSLAFKRVAGLGARSPSPSRTSPGSWARRRSHDRNQIACSEVGRLHLQGFSITY